MVEGRVLLKQFRVPHCTFGARGMLEVQGTLEVHQRYMLDDNPYVVACCVLVSGTLVDMVPRIPRVSNETKTTKLKKQRNWKN